MGKSAAELLFNILNVIVAICVISTGVIYITWAVDGEVWLNLITALYIIFFGVLIFLIELKPPELLLIAFGFFRWWAGRGLFYIFCGVLSIPIYYSEWFYVFLTVFPCVIGVIYVILEFVKVLPQPSPLL
eukprot:TRINITY_DN18557_c0_g1_i1.p1 TRINITY_DN18557_c0_g1~~TRINITY_DN18557_c0_g1_i1.p1  ORF type:complete len:130 (-),score=9.41 TRINITY_DN18557_c0_g1_i1:35-424(-)